MSDLFKGAIFCAGGYSSSRQGILDPRFRSSQDGSGTCNNDAKYSKRRSVGSWKKIKNISLARKIFLKISREVFFSKYSGTCPKFFLTKKSGKRFQNYFREKVFKNYFPENFPPLKKIKNNRHLTPENPHRFP